MVALIRHALAIAVLPLTVVVVVPVWIAKRYGIALSLGQSADRVGLQAFGLVVILVGVLLLVGSLRRFASDGQGTLAPWDPPRKLVVRGLYRIVRNPMISGVIFELFGEAFVMLSKPHFVWALSCLVVNLIYIPLVEEPELEARFGESYREYCEHVPRFLPRLRP